jgi:hypothetical protein
VASQPLSCVFLGNDQWKGAMKMPVETTHTPGPWVIDNEDFGRPMDNGRILHCPPYGGGGYVVVADCSLAATNNNPDWQSNARLVAAAPDLLAALEGMVSAFRPFTMKPIGGEGSPARLEQETQIAAYKEARAALSKAHGHG